MRNFSVSVAAALLVSIMLTACGSGGGGPEGVVSNFFKLAKAGNFEKAVELYPPEATKQPGAREKLVAYLKAGLSEHEGIASYSVGTAEVTENSASVPYTLTFKDNSEDEGTMNVKKIEGKWYLSFN